MKTGREMFFTFVLFLTPVVVAECSKLPENHDLIRELTDVIHRLEAKVAEIETKRDEEMTRLLKEFSQIKVKMADTEVQTDKSVKFKEQGRVNFTRCNLPTCK